MDDLFSPTKQAREVTSRLWRRASERASWSSDLGGSFTAARLAYCTAVLALQAQPLLKHLEADKAGQAKQAAPEAAVKPRPAAARLVGARDKRKPSVAREGRVTRSRAA